MLQGRSQDQQATDVNMLLAKQNKDKASVNLVLTTIGQLHDGCKHAADQTGQ